MPGRKLLLGHELNFYSNAPDYVIDWTITFKFVEGVVISHIGHD
jgi:hypothetical protein